MDPELVVLENSLKYLTTVLLFPNKKERKKPGKLFYVKYVLFHISTIGAYIGSTLHLVKNIKERTFINTDLDIALLISLTGCYYFNSYFVSKVENTLKLCRLFSNFRAYGKPKNFETENRRLNDLSFAHRIYITIAVIGFAEAPLLEKGRCDEENVKKSLNEVCGIIGAAWWPFDFSSYPYKQLYFAYQIYSVCLTYHTASTVSFAIMESTEHLILRFKHVKFLFEEALKCQNSSKRRECFIRSVKYHTGVINMAIILNKSFRGCLFEHVFLAAGVLGCVGYRLVKSFSLGGLCLYFGWMSALVMVCYSGQKLIIESTAVGEAIYNSEWYNFECALQKELIMVILRSQKPVHLEAGSFGNMTYPMLMMILKTSYSYLSLLRRSNNRQ